MSAPRTGDEPIATSVTQAVADAVERVREFTVDIRVADGSAGAGVVWNDNGLVISNAHVVVRDRVRVRFRDGRSTTARLVARDQSRDLAALELDADTPRAATIADAAVARVGQFMFAVGSPLGVVGGVAVGIVHSVEHSRDGLPNYIRTSIRLAPGNSGGPLADIQARVHGVNSMIINGVGVARGIATVRRFLRRAHTGRALGVMLRPVPLLRRGASALGLLVTHVREHSIAAHVGIGVGDVLLTADGKPFSEPGSLADHIDALSTDETLRLEVGRAGHARMIPVSFADADAHAA